MKETILDYIQKTPEMIRKNVQNNKELTKSLFTLEVIPIALCPSSFNFCKARMEFVEHPLCDTTTTNGFPKN